MANVVFVSDIPDGTSEGDLQVFMESIDTVDHVFMLADAKGELNGTALVVYRARHACADAVSDLNDTSMDASTHKIKVQLPSPKQLKDAKDLIAEADKSGVDRLERFLSSFSEADRRRTMSAYLSRNPTLKPESSDTVRLSVGTTEHPSELIVRTATPNIRRLRSFSNKTPVPSGELDYPTWKLNAKILIDDSSVSETDKRKTLSNSLNVPALSFVQPLLENPDVTSAEILKNMDLMFGTVASTRALYKKFIDTYQKEETAAEYLKNLYDQALKLVESECITSTAMDETLKEQFIEGCHDEDLLQKLKLDEAETMQFAEFLHKVRETEHVRDEKRKRFTSLKGNKSKTVKADSKQEHATSKSSFPSQSKSERNSIEEALVSIRKELAQLKTSLPMKAKNMQHEVKSSKKKNFHKKSSQKKFKTFCYKCGEDDHLLNSCRNESNPVLVQTKLLERSSSKKSGN